MLIIIFFLFVYLFVCFFYYQIKYIYHLLMEYNVTHPPIYSLILILIHILIKRYNFLIF